MTVMAALRVDKILRCVKGPKILDVGCTSHTLAVGSSEWLHGRLREIFHGIAGIDISDQNIRALQEMGFTNLRTQSAESFELGEKFDTIVAGELIEHLANPGLFLRQARSHLNDEGIVVLTTPNAFSLAYFLYAFFKFPNTCFNQEHTCWFCLRTMTELARRNGFEVRHFEFLDDYHPNDSSFLYRQFARAMSILGPLIPKRLRKTMLFVLIPSNGPFNSQYVSATLVTCEADEPSQVGNRRLDKIQMLAGPSK